MKKIPLKLAAFALVALAGGAAQAQIAVGASVDIAVPGVYGRINIGDIPAPALYQPQPVIAVPPAVVINRAPIYLYVPPEHQRDWRRYCGQYSACNQPVYFVREDWVRERYVRDHPGWGRHDRDHDRREHGPDRDRRDHRD